MVESKPYPADLLLWQGDCLDLMKNLPDKSVDMILCDPPYGVTQNKADVMIPLDPLWKEYNRITKETSCVAIFAQGKFFVDLVESNRKMFRYDLIWDKCLTTGFLNANRMPLRQHEQIAVFYRKLPTYNPQFSIGKPLHARGTAYLASDSVNHNYGQFKITEDTRKGCTEKYPTSILRFQKPHPSASLHCTEKPVACLEYLVKTYTHKGDTVLDNCMGSGSTGVACAHTGRRFIGMELDETYFSVAKARIEDAWTGWTGISNKGGVTSHAN